MLFYLEVVVTAYERCYASGSFGISFVFGVLVAGPTKACGIMMPSHLKALFVPVRLMKGSTLFSSPVDSE